MQPSNLATSTPDVYFLNGQDSATGTNALDIRNFIAAGGGLVTASQAWYFSGPADQHPSNKLLVSFNSNGCLSVLTECTQWQLQNPTQSFPCVPHAHRS